MSFRSADKQFHVVGPVYLRFQPVAWSAPAVQYVQFGKVLLHLHKLLLRVGLHRSPTLAPTRIWHFFQIWQKMAPDKIPSEPDAIAGY